MKKLLILVTILLMSTIWSTICYAAEPKQEIKNDQAYFTANLQKQPEKDNKQKIGNHFSFFVINVQINGKIKDFVPANNVR